MDPPKTPSALTSFSDSTSGPVTLGVRKRVDSNPSQSPESSQGVNANKRPRTSFYDLISNDSVESLLLECTSPEVQPRLLPYPLPSTPTPNYRRDSFGFIDDRSLPKRPDPSDPRSPDAVSIFGTPSRRSRRPARDEPAINAVTSPEPPSEFAIRFELRRSMSFSSAEGIRASGRSRTPRNPADLRFGPHFPPTEPTLAELLAIVSPPRPPTPEASAKHWLRNTSVTIDYKPPKTSNPITGRLIARSADNYLYFTRGDRVHYKNLGGNGADEIGQLFKLKDSEGHLRVMEANLKNRCNILAIGTSRCKIQLWDLETKKMTATWSNGRDISAMAWNGHTLTVGGVKGSIRHYDIRIPVDKITKRALKIERHESQITSLSWNPQGEILASGDASGNIFCWKSGASVPMEFGDVVQRRKKVVQAGKISALAWCPWRTNALVTGDSSGTMRLWDVHERFSASNVIEPGFMYTKAAVTGMHFSQRADCPELLSTHGGISPVVTRNYGRPHVANAISVVAFPGTNTAKISQLSGIPDEGKAIGNSVLDAYGTKLIFETPEDGKINITEIWKRREVREVRKHVSMTSVEALSRMIR